MEEGKAFDAGESYICDSAQAVSSRHTVSLVVALRSILRRGPQFQQQSLGARLGAFRAAAEELTLRGIDAASLIRYGMYREIMAPLLGGLIFRLIPAPIGYAPGSLPHGLDAAGWCQALGLENWTGDETLSVPEALEFLMRAIVPVFPVIERWVMTAQLDDLVLLSPPTDIEALRDYDDPLLEELREQYIWAVDHFTETYYEDWQTSSLHHAYRWLTRCAPPPCPIEQMQERKIDLAKLNAEIARRATSDKPDETMSLSSGALLAPEMVRYAKPLLEQGRYREAAAVFEFGTQQVPNNGEFRNNLGFCLIPVDPAAALGHLEAAMRLNFSQCEVNVYNQMCCLVSLHNERAALNIADLAWERIQSQPVLAAVLWQRSAGGGWSLCSVDDPRRKVAELAASIAAGEGWDRDTEIWRTRLRYFDET